jgi:hypothetical protein
MFPPYVVAAASRRAAPRRPGTDPSTDRPSGFLPLGVRHAVPTAADPEVSTRTSLCGTSLAGWFMFVSLPFTGGEPADCQRCEQVLRARARAEREGKP